MEKERIHSKNQKWANGKLANSNVSMTKVNSLYFLFLYKFRNNMLLIKPNSYYFL